tara:strand:- start:2210 stop:2419 length:210 start_codon:yes stop_codon:yes gene_type:complete
MVTNGCTSLSAATAVLVRLLLHEELAEDQTSHGGHQDLFRLHIVLISLDIFLRHRGQVGFEKTQLVMHG